MNYCMYLFTFISMRAHFSCDFIFELSSNFQWTHNSYLEASSFQGMAACLLQIDTFLACLQFEDTSIEKFISLFMCVHYCSEKIDTLFSGLTKDLMDPNNSMEQTFELIQELKTATEKYFHLKKLFWKVSLLWSQQVVFDLAVIFYNFINPQRIEYKQKLCRNLFML